MRVFCPYLEISFWSTLISLAQFIINRVSSQDNGILLQDYGISHYGQDVIAFIPIRIPANGLPCQALVATMHGQRVSPDDSGHVHLLLQVLIPLAGDQSVLVAPPDFHWPCWLALYCFTTANETVATVEMKFEGVPKVGRLLFMNGNPSRMAWAGQPLLCPTTWLPPILGSASNMR